MRCLTRYSQGSLGSRRSKAKFQEETYATLVQTMGILAAHEHVVLLLHFDGICPRRAA
jgi:hypothetical protein